MTKSPHKGKSVMMIVQKSPKNNNSMMAAPSILVDPEVNTMTMNKTEAEEFLLRTMQVREVEVRLEFKQVIRLFVLKLLICFLYV